jgi:hypothetical protein
VRDLAPKADQTATEEEEEVAEAVKALRRAGARCSEAIRRIS